MSYASIAGHRSMALDEVRNTAYLGALREVVTPTSVVLDLGAGLGTLGMLAARLGARRVYLVEPADVVSVAREVVQANGLADRVEVLHGRIETVAVPEPVDVITSVMTGNFLLSEDLLPTVFHARDRFLAADGVLLPSAATMRVVPVSAPALHRKEVGCWSESHLGLDFEVARAYAANSVYVNAREARAATYLATPADLMTLDLATASVASCDAQCSVVCESPGTCHGVLGWFDMQLGSSVLSTAPHAPRVHWAPLFFPIDSPIEVAAGESVSIAITRPPSGDWSWTVTTPHTTRRQSTFFARPITRDALRAAAPDAKAAISIEGAAARHVLEHMQGERSAAALAEDLVARFGARFTTLDEALAFVVALIRQYGEA